MRIFLYTLVLTTVLLFRAPFTVQSSSVEEIVECAEQITNATAAYETHDWPQLERIAQRIIQSCRGKASSVSGGYDSLATAYNKMNRPQEALDAAVSCIDFSYIYSSGCHIQKAKALKALGRLTEARATIEIAEKLLKQSLSRNESDIREARSCAERNRDVLQRKVCQSQLGNYIASKNLYETQQRYIEHFKIELDVSDHNP